MHEFYSAIDALRRGVGADSCRSAHKRGICAREHDRQMSVGEESGERRAESGEQEDERGGRGVEGVSRRKMERWRLMVIREWWVVGGGW